MQFLLVFIVILIGLGIAAARSRRIGVDAGSRATKEHQNLVLVVNWANLKLSMRALVRQAGIAAGIGAVGLGVGLLTEQSVLAIVFFAGLVWCIVSLVRLMAITQTLHTLEKELRDTGHDISALTVQLKRGEIGVSGQGSPTSFGGRLG